MGGFKKVHTHPRVGFAGAPTKRDNGMAKRDDCSGTSFYTAPTSGQSVDSANKVTFSWNNKCLSPAPEYVDIYLYAPSKNDSMIQAFDSAKYADGSLQTSLDPNWWGLDASVQLQLQIVQHGSNQFMSSLAVGPVWTATYNSTEAPAPKLASGDPSVAQRVKNILHALPGGSIAAAVIFPLLFVGGLIAFFYIRRARRKTEAKTNRFSRAVDQRMSTISTDWRSISGAGANAAVRNSMAVRSSDVSGDRPSSVFAGQAGIGALRTSEEPVPQMEEMRRARQSVFTSGERTSRISFAPDVRTSYAEKENPRLPSAVRGLNVRSFHQGHTSFDDERPEDAHNRDLTMSPTQAAGPTLLHPGDIVARASIDNDPEFKQDVLQMPAMTLMRTGGASDSEFVLPATPVAPAANTAYASAMPAIPSAALQPNTPMSGMTPAGNGPAGPGLSPDALLRAYAAGRPLASPPPTTPGASSGGMRVLYQNEPTTPMATPQYPQIHQYPSSPSVATSATLAPSDNNPFRKSMAQSDAVRASAYTESMYSAGAYEAYNDEDAYDTEHHDTTHHGYGQAK